MRRYINTLLIAVILMALFLPTWVPYPCFKEPCIVGHGCKRGDTECIKQSADESDEVPEVDLQSLVDWFYTLKPFG